MISDWRVKFNGGNSPILGRPRPFLFVQLAPYTEGVGEEGDISTAILREAQEAALHTARAQAGGPLVGMASAVDYGDTDSPLGNIHPRWKAPVGLRLSLAARALAYNEQGLLFEGPFLFKAVICPTQSFGSLPAQKASLNSSVAVCLTFDQPVFLLPPHDWPMPPARKPIRMCVAVHWRI